MLLKSLVPLQNLASHFYTSWNCLTQSYESSTAIYCTCSPVEGDCARSYNTSSCCMFVTVPKRGPDLIMQGSDSGTVMQELCLSAKICTCGTYCRIRPSSQILLHLKSSSQMKITHLLDGSRHVLTGINMPQSKAPAFKTPKLRKIPHLDPNSAATLQLSNATNHKPSYNNTEFWKNTKRHTMGTDDYFRTGNMP